MEMVRTLMLEEIAKPTGEVSGVCWALLGAVVTGAGIVLKYLTGKLDKVTAEKDALHAARLLDREKFEASTNVLVNTILSKKKGESP